MQVLQRDDHLILARSAVCDNACDLACSSSGPPLIRKTPAPISIIVFQVHPSIIPHVRATTTVLVLEQSDATKKAREHLRVRVPYCMLGTRCPSRPDPRYPVSPHFGSVISIPAFDVPATVDGTLIRLRNSAGDMLG